MAIAADQASGNITAKLTCRLRALASNRSGGASGYGLIAPCWLHSTVEARERLLSATNRPTAQPKTKTEAAACVDRL